MITGAGEVAIVGGAFLVAVGLAHTRVLRREELDAINAVLATAGYNFRRLIQWLRLLVFRILGALGTATQLKSV
jgi:hypothetical protein